MLVKTLNPRGGSKGRFKVKKCISLALILVLLCAIPAADAAQEERKAKNGKTEEVVVTATRIETPTKGVAASTTVVSAERIENEQKTLVSDVLRRLLSIDVVRNGGPGKTTSVFIRGANSEHTLVLVDGIEMNDPIMTGRTFDFANLTAENIERVEVIRGPQSTLYGSDAMGGVINIITKRGSGRPTFHIAAEAGSFNTFTEKTGVSGGTSLVNYSLGVSRIDTDGISSAGEKYGNTEKDGYKNTSVSTRLGLTPTENLDVDLILKYSDSTSDIDNAGGASGDDPNNVYETRRLFARAVADLALLDGLWEQKLGVSLSDHSRNNDNGKDPAHPNDLVRSSFDSSLYKVDWQHDLYLHETNTITAGVEYEEEEGNSDYYSESSWGPYSSTFDKRSAHTAGYYVQDRAKFKDSLFATLGVRVDDHSKFGSETTYRATAAYLIKPSGTKLKGAYGTGFKAPSLYQLYSQYGDPNLGPEKSTGWDVGVEQSLLGGRVSVSATYFHNDFENLIEYDSTASMYSNVAGARTEGVELYASLSPHDNIDLRAGYTYTDTEDKSTGEALRRRARNKVTADFNWRFHGKGNVNVGVVYVGSRDDLDYSAWPATPVTLDSYTLVDLAASYHVTDNVQLTGRVENLLDEDYEEAKGYGTSGFAAYGGVKIML